MYNIKSTHQEKNIFPKIQSRLNNWIFRHLRFLSLILQCADAGKIRSGRKAWSSSSWVNSRSATAHVFQCAWGRQVGQHTWMGKDEIFFFFSFPNILIFYEHLFDVVLNIHGFYAGEEMMQKKIQSVTLALSQPSFHVHTHKQAHALLFMPRVRADEHKVNTITAESGARAAVSDFFISRLLPQHMSLNPVRLFFGTFWPQGVSLDPECASVFAQNPDFRSTFWLKKYKWK